MFFSNLKTNKFNTTQKIVIFISVLAIATISYKFITKILVTIPSGEVGIFYLTNKEESSDSPLLPGIHIVNPFDKVVPISTRVQAINQTIELISKEGINFKLDVNLQYQIDPQKASQVDQNMGDNQQEIIGDRRNKF